MISELTVQHVYASSRLQLVSQQEAILLLFIYPDNADSEFVGREVCKNDI